MAENGNGKNGNYTAQQFIDAIPGTGGIISAIAERVGCAWHTAKRYIDTYATINQAWQNERNRITDRAQNNIVKSIVDGDLQMSKWWLQVMDDQFMPRQRTELAGEVTQRIIVVDWDDDGTDDADSG